jgi:hypothetical protein
MAKRSSIVSPIYTGAYSRAINRAAAGILSRKKKNKKNNKAARDAASRRLERKNARVRRSIEEQKRRALANPPSIPLDQSAGKLVEPTSKAVGATPRASCTFCTAQVENLGEHIRTNHGSEKFVRWLLSRCTGPRSTL